jgi:hypothetical protein
MGPNGSGPDVMDVMWRGVKSPYRARARLFYAGYAAFCGFPPPPLPQRARRGPEQQFFPASPGRRNLSRSPAAHG